MLVIPAIDLLDGRAVRLARGRRDEATIYSERPWELAQRFVGVGAKLLHVVDLDGAFAGRLSQLDLIERIIGVAHAEGAQIEVGGGVRSAEDVERLVSLGADAVVLGTAAVSRPEVAEALCRRFPGRIVVAIDARRGMVAVEGWTQTSTVAAAELAQRAESWGARALLYTDVERDGLQVGPNLAATVALQQGVQIPVIASGGVSSMTDLRQLASVGVRAVVLGRALYEGNVDLQEALTC